jgi:hypothetical protein
MALGPGSGWLVGNKAINLDFLASFSLVHFFWTGKRNEQLNRFAASKMLIYFQKRSGGISRLTAI